MPLKGSIRSISASIPLYAKANDVPPDTKWWALTSEGDTSKGQKALERAAEELGIAKDALTVFAAGREGNFWVVSAGYEVPEGPPGTVIVMPEG